MVSKLVIRHLQSPVNVFQEISSGSLERPALGNLDAGITDRAWEVQAVKVARELTDQRGVDIASTPVAVSEFWRTHESARAIGFRNLVVRPVLNEVLRDDPAETARLAARDILPFEATIQAWQALHESPEEPVWISHGLTIAGMRHILKINGRRLVPRNGEITSVVV